MDGTEGLVRGHAVVDTGSPIKIPVGEETLGRIINVIGDPIDERGPINTDKVRVTPSLNLAPLLRNLLLFFQVEYFLLFFLSQTLTYKLLEE